MFLFLALFVLAGAENCKESCVKCDSCSSATENQSPINIVQTAVEDAADEDVEELVFEFWNAKVPGVLLNTGKFIQAKPKGDAKWDYFLKGTFDEHNPDDEDLRYGSFHFHAASPHTNAGTRYDMEGHFFHVNAESEMAVVAMWWEEGDTECPFLATFKDLVHDDDTVEDFTLDATLLRDAVADMADPYFYSYKGSTCIYPCKQPLQWFIMPKPFTATKEQLDWFRLWDTPEKSETGGNFRDPQPDLGTRTIWKFPVVIPEEGLGARLMVSQIVLLAVVLVLVFFK